jgi:hypothetical protein
MTAAYTHEAPDAAWPALPLAEWRDTKDTLHRWTQIVGKVRLALAPMQNHWWQVPLYVTARGLTTSAMPYDGGVLEIRFDFVHHVLALEASSGHGRHVALAPRPVAEFYREVMAALGALGTRVRIHPRPIEIPGDARRFDEDAAHRTYDADSAQRCWRVLVRADRVLHAFRGGFLGKCSPVHFWWGSFDLACTRFSGRRAPPHPGGVPNCPDYVTREAYSHECISAGWWPGGGAVDEPAFYAYAYPEPAGCAAAPIRPAPAYYHPELREWILPYDAVRTASDPDAMLLAFLDSTYDVAATLGRWDRAALEREVHRQGEPHPRVDGR